jgi:hypothetical protein
MLTFVGDCRLQIQVNPNITIQWIPGHSGIPGNDIVDLVAKWSVASPVLPIVTPAKTAESCIQDMVQQIAKKWKLKQATVTSLCNNETANTISHRSLIRLHSATFSKYNTYPSSNGFFQLELLLAQNQSRRYPKVSMRLQQRNHCPFSSLLSDVSRTKKSSPQQYNKDRRQVGVPSEPRCSPGSTQMHSINFGFRRRGYARTNSHLICF